MLDPATKENSNLLSIDQKAPGRKSLLNYISQHPWFELLNFRYDLKMSLMLVNLSFESECLCLKDVFLSQHSVIPSFFVASDKY